MEPTAYYYLSSIPLNGTLQSNWDLNANLSDESLLRGNHKTTAKTNLIAQYSMDQCIIGKYAAFYYLKYDLHPILLTDGYCINGK